MAGAACIAGYAILPELSDSLTPKIPLSWLKLTCYWNFTTFLYIFPTYSVSRNMKVFLISNPHAIISLAFSNPYFVNVYSLSSVFEWKYYSSSVNWITKGTSNESWRYLVNIKGSKWPKCMASEDGPLPV